MRNVVVLRPLRRMIGAMKTRMMLMLMLMLIAAQERPQRDAFAAGYGSPHATVAAAGFVLAGLGCLAAGFPGEKTSEIVV